MTKIKKSQCDGGGRNLRNHQPVIFIISMEAKKNEDSSSRPLHVGRKFDGTLIDLSKIDEITKPMRKEFLINFSFLQSLESCLKRKVDLSILYVFLSITCTVVPLSLALMTLEYTSGLSYWYLHALGLVRLLFGVLQTEGFVLGLHYSSHRPIFKPDWEWVDYWVNIVISPLIGFPSNTYMAHHVTMHHKEDNAINYDASSTMPFQRDSWFHLLLYILRYLFFIQIELPLSLLLRGRYKETVTMLVGYFGYMTCVYYCYQVLPIATLWVNILPFIILSVAAMRGNNIQHVFVSPEEPEDDFKLCYDLVNDPTNCGKFNDSFHVEHHLSPITHWAELPTKFLEFLPRHKKQDSFIFTGLTPDDVHGYVMSGRLDILADSYVHIGQKSGKDKETLVKEMKHRLEPIRKFTKGKTSGGRRTATPASKKKE